MHHWVEETRPPVTSSLMCVTGVTHFSQPPLMATNKMEGRREDALVKQRLQAREEYERQKQNLINETEKARPSANRFVGQNDSMEESLKNSTIGLVRLEDFQQKRKELEEQKLREAARTSELKYVSVFCWRLSLPVVQSIFTYSVWRIRLEMTQGKLRNVKKLPKPLFPLH